MTLVLDHSAPPRGGYPFKDPSGFVIVRDTLAGLIAAVVAYREKNGLPAGQPWEEVERAYKVKYPWLVSKVGANPATKEDPIKTWLNAKSRAPITDLAEPELVDARLATCAGCEYYAAHHPFDADSQRRIAIIGAGRAKEAGACRIHHWPVGLVVVARTPEGRAAVDAPGCWAE